MDIVEELRHDREAGAKRLETEYKTGLMALALRFCNDPGDAEELVNSTFAEVVENVDDFLEQSSLFTWMCKILTSKFTRTVRRKSNQMEVYPGVLPDVVDEDAQESIYANLDASLLRDAIDTLPPDIRKTLTMHYFMDFSVKDVARMLAVPAGTVKWRLHYARKILAAKLGAAAKKPGGKALLVALALCGLTALGAAVYNLANNGEARNMGGAASGRRGGADRRDGRGDGRDRQSRRSRKSFRPRPFSSTTPGKKHERYNTTHTRRFGGIRGRWRGRPRPSRRIPVHHFWRHRVGRHGGRRGGGVGHRPVGRSPPRRRRIAPNGPFLHQERRLRHGH